MLPVVVAALPAVWRAGPRFVAAAVVVGAGSSALATILFTPAFVDGNPVTPVVLQKVQPLIAVSLAAVMLGERPRPRFGLFLVGGLVGTWLMAFPSPFDVSLHGLAPGHGVLTLICPASRVRHVLGAQRLESLRFRDGTLAGECSAGSWRRDAGLPGCYP